MNNLEAKNLALKLVKSETETEVVDILNQYNLLENNNYVAFSKVLNIF